MGLTATVKGSQDDESFLNFLRDGVIPALKKRGLSPSKPALLVLDGHSSRLTSGTVKLLLDNSIVGIIIPSHTSTIHQPADLNYQAVLQTTFEYNVRARVGVM